MTCKCSDGKGMTDVNCLRPGHSAKSLGLSIANSDEESLQREPCTCTIACIPQGLVGEQVCRLR